MIDTKTSKPPFEPGCQLFKATQNNKLCDSKLYQELTGSLNHLAIFSQSTNISFAISKLL